MVRTDGAKLSVTKQKQFQMTRQKLRGQVSSGSIMCTITHVVENCFDEFSLGKWMQKVLIAPSQKRLAVHLNTAKRSSMANRV